jgi:hypothetical protein
MIKNYNTTKITGSPPWTKVDVCVMDFDSCIYPGISKVAIALDLTVRILFAPFSWQDWRYLPRLAYAGVYLLFLRLVQKISGHPLDGELVQSYQKLLGVLPEGYFRASARRILRHLNPQVLETFRLIGTRIPVGIISLALEPMLAEFDAMLRQDGLPGLAFSFGNPPKPQSGGSSKQVLTGEHKRRLLMEVLENHKWERPLVIGNDREDLGMIDLAHEKGGIAIGIAPSREIASHFDYPLSSRRWDEVKQILAKLLA